MSLPQQTPILERKDLRRLTDRVLSRIASILVCGALSPNPHSDPPIFLHHVPRYLLTLTPSPNRSVGGRHHHRCLWDRDDSAVIRLRHAVSWRNMDRAEVHVQGKADRPVQLPAVRRRAGAGPDCIGVAGVGSQ